MCLCIWLWLGDRKGKGASVYVLPWAVRTDEKDCQWVIGELKELANPAFAVLFCEWRNDLVITFIDLGQVLRHSSPIWKKLKSLYSWFGKGFPFFGQPLSASTCRATGVTSVAQWHTWWDEGQTWEQIVPGGYFSVDLDTVLEWGEGREIILNKLLSLNLKTFRDSRQGLGNVLVMCFSQDGLQKYAWELLTCLGII